MAINADKPHLWKKDIEASVDRFNNWFMRFAPKAYRDTRVETTKHVEAALRITRDLALIKPDLLRQHPEVLPTLRIATCPPLARDRLVGLAHANKSLVASMERGKLSARMPDSELAENLLRISDAINRMLDADIFPWLEGKQAPTRRERRRAATIVADRLCGAVADPIIRNAQEERQLRLISKHLRKKGYTRKAHVLSLPINRMEPGTFSFRMTVIVGDARKVRIPVDVVVQPLTLGPDRIPILIEAKSAGDFTNVNKRRKEEATKVHQLRATYGDQTQFVLFLCGYFDTGYLGYEAAEGIDWVWEHRIEDLYQLGL
jgi:hypothetical protein